MRSVLRKVLMSATVAIAATTAGFAVGLAPAEAWAGPNSEEIWFGTGADSLEVDENGKLTEAGAKTKTSEVDRIPGEEDWELKLHARMGKHAAEGPLYVEFYQTVQGKEYIVYRHEDADYGGERLYTNTILLEANIGFNKDREYRVQIVQNNGKRDLVLAKGKVKLIDTGRQPEGAEEEEAAEEDEGEEDEGEEDEEEDEDEDEVEAAEGGEEAPPPIDETPAKKKGCSVAAGGAADLGATGLGILLLAAAMGRRRRD
jgi:MYXO-CTERM domain-containing protein